MGKAKLTAVEELHSTLAETLKEAIKERGEDGKINASVLNVARQFLKDNNIQVDPASPAVKGLTDSVVAALPFAGDTVEDPREHSKPH